MREAAFLKTHAGKWKSIEAFFAGRQKLSPDQLAEAYVQLTDDLAYSQTYYPKSNTTRYLNGLTLKVHQAIYRRKKERANRLTAFWRFEYPEAVRLSYKELLISFIIFVVAILVGTLSTLYDESFARLILGDSYINMTLENIKNNDPLAVYKQMNEVDMFLGLTFNNLRVAFLAFVMGIMFSFMTGYILFQNGVMLGVFHVFFYKKGLLTSALTTVWIHGTLEISAIIVAGAAGLVLGNGILFPGTYKRKDAFVAGARRGLKLVIGLVPLFIVAGFLEGFVTRYTDMPLVLKLGIIGLSLFFVIYYFLILPGGLRKEEAGGTHPTN